MATLKNCWTISPITYILLRMKRIEKARNFWQQLPKPFFCLAPMYDVTDAAFRAMFIKYGGPDVFFTEFVSADGLVSDKGRPKLRRELYFTATERPIVAQLFGRQPENIEQAINLIKELGFDGIDINMGCPDRAIEKQGAGAALIKNPQLAQEIISVAKKSGLPVSVKTRLGYNEIDESWWRTILEANPDTVTFHLRTKKELSNVPAHYEELPNITKIFKDSGIIIIANGDIKSVEEGKELAKKYNLDGFMIGRGSLGKPWLGTCKDISLKEKLNVMLEHTQLFWDLYGPTETNQKLFHGHQKNFAVMRKHFKAYVSGFKGATALRVKLMQTQNPDQVEQIVNEFLNLL